MISYIRVPGFVLFFTLALAGCQFTKTHYSTAKAIHNNGSVVSVKANRLNLRQCASNKCRILQVLSHGETLTVLSQKGIWIKVSRHKDGNKGWLSSKYVIVQGSRPASRSKNIKRQFSASSPPGKNQEQALKSIAEDSPPKPAVSTSTMLEEELTPIPDERQTRNAAQEQVPDSIEDEFLTADNSPPDMVQDRLTQSTQTQAPAKMLQKTRTNPELAEAVVPLPSVDPIPLQKEPETPPQVEDEFSD